MPHAAALLLSVLAIGPARASLEAPGLPHQERTLAAVLASQIEVVPGWPWERGGPQPAPNIGGVIALGLLRSYEANPDPATWVTLVQYAQHLRQVYGDNDVLPYKADIEFLARVGDAELDRDAPQLASRLFDRVKRESPSGAVEYQRIADGRVTTPEIIGYDVALSIRAAEAVGQYAYAAELADAVLGAGHLRIHDRNDSFQIASAGALLHAVAQLGRRADVVSREAAARSLMEAQSAAGSWATNNVQATAYAILGLSVTPTVPGALDAAGRGRAWLVEHQLEAGGWPAYDDGLPEPFVGPVIPLAEAEALTAVLALEE